MTIPITKERFSITVSSGAGTANTMKHSGTELVQIYTKSTTSTNIYDLSLVDEDSETIWEELAIQGELEEHGVYVPLRGIYTITISNATIDEAIVVKIMLDG